MSGAFEQMIFLILCFVYFDLDENLTLLQLGLQL